MRNLLDRLKPEHKRKMNEDRKLYPSTIELLENNLQKNYSIITLEFGSAIQVHSTCCNGVFDMSETFNLFEDE